MSGRKANSSIKAAQQLLDLSLAGRERSDIRARLVLADEVVVGLIDEALKGGATWKQIGDALDDDRALVYSWHRKRTVLEL